MNKFLIQFVTFKKNMQIIHVNMFVYNQQSDTRLALETQLPGTRESLRSYMLL